jgi:hypothetical protein
LEVNVMRAEAHALGQSLLDHHRAKTAAIPPGKRLIAARYTLSYSDLCARAGAAHLTRVAGSFLGEIAQWCADSGYPPLNALAVSSSSGQPGEGYDGAGGFKSINWVVDVEACIRFTNYPEKLPP